MSKLIMTADDSASVRQMVSFTLKQSGYDVLEAVDGQDALTKLASQKVDMLITDLAVPHFLPGPVTSAKSCHSSFRSSCISRLIGIGVTREHRTESPVVAM